MTRGGSSLVEDLEELATSVRLERLLGVFGEKDRVAGPRCLGGLDHHVHSLVATCDGPRQPLASTPGRAFLGSAVDTPFTPCAGAGGRPPQPPNPANPKAHRT